MRRSIHIDIMKGLLTIGMILAHVWQLLGNGQQWVLNQFSLLINLVSFSGFLFCFGFAVWYAYFSKPNVPYKSMFKVIMKCYAAFVISGIGFRVLFESAPFSIQILKDIVLLRDIPGYSEFLLSFSLVLSICVLLKRVILLIVSNNTLLLLIIMLCLSFAFLPPNQQYDPILGLLVGGVGFAYFPVAQYFPFFILGIVFAKRHYLFNRLLFILATVNMILSVSLFQYYGEVRRFPPELLWILGSWSCVYVYFLLAKWLELKLPQPLIIYLTYLGRHVLFYLVFSNLVLFTVHHLIQPERLVTWQVFVFYLLLMGSAIITQSLISSCWHYLGAKCLPEKSNP